MAKTKFEVKENGKVFKLAVVHPTEQVLAEANAVQNKIFKESIGNGALLGVTLDKVMREQGLWDETKQKKLEELSKKINEARYKLKKGGIKKSEGKSLAMSVLNNIGEQRVLLAERSAYASRTADGQADSARFNYLVSACTVEDDTGKKVFENQAEYENKAGTEVGSMAANTLAEVMYGIGSTADANNVEYKFLKQFGYVDEKLRFINEQGKLVDRNGRLISEDGRYITEDGKYCDINGNLVDENGELLVETQPFLDDDGEPIVDKTVEKIVLVEAKEDRELVTV